MQLSREFPLRGQGLLYPLLVIVGIATITGWMPNSMVGTSSPVTTAPERVLAQTTVTTVTDPSEGTVSGPAFQCAECGVIESVREIERGGSLASTSLTGLERPPATTTTTRASGF
jgi:hypothetical protein